MPEEPVTPPKVIPPTEPPAAGPAEEQPAAGRAEQKKADGDPEAKANDAKAVDRQGEEGKPDAEEPAEPEKPAVPAVPAVQSKPEERINFLGITNREAWMILFLFIAGGLGAVTANVMGKSIMIWEFGGIKASPLGFESTLLVGGIAAGLGVYLVAASDVRLVGRTLFFSVACGLSAQIVISKAMTSLQETMGIEVKGDVGHTDIDPMNNVNAGGSDTSRALLIADAQDAAMLYIERARMANSVSDFERSAVFQRKAAQQVMDIASAGANEPREVLDAIGRIGDWAKAAGATEVVRAVEERVKGIIVVSKSKEQPALAAEAKAIREDLKPVIVGEPPATATTLGGRVYLEVGETYVNDLPVEWKSVTGVDDFTFILPRTASDTDYKERRVIYYRPEDRDGAENLLEKVKKTVGEGFEYGRVGTFLIKGVTGARPQHYDLRIGRLVIETIAENLKKKPASAPVPPPPPTNSGNNGKKKQP